MQPEHDERTHATPVDDPTGQMSGKRVTNDLGDSEDEEITTDKTQDQLDLEAHERWKLFHYPKWATFMIYVMFFCSVVNVILTLDQWHGTHAWRKPFDVQPINHFTGGWNDDELRFAASILGLIASCFSFVLSPTADKFKFMFLLMFAASAMACVQFGKDLYHLNRAVDLPHCNQINDNKSEKFVCEFTRYRATVIFDILCGVFGTLMSFFILWQALTGTVSRVLAYNAQTNKFEKIVLGPNDDYFAAFPARFKKQRPVFVICITVVALCFGVLLALSVTQTTNDYNRAPGEEMAKYNRYRTTPVDHFLISGDEAIRFGSWPKDNFTLRLSTNALALVVLSFLIQWRRDGRAAQLVVLVLLLFAGIMYCAAFSIDFTEYDKDPQECQFRRATGHKCVFQRYLATIIFDGFCGFLLIIFSITNIMNLLAQASTPREVIPDRDYGWWWNGEWTAKKDMKAANKAINKQTDDDE